LFVIYPCCLPLRNYLCNIAGQKRQSRRSRRNQCRRGNRGGREKERVNTQVYVCMNVWVVDAWNFPKISRLPFLFHKSFPSALFFLFPILSLRFTHCPFPFVFKCLNFRFGICILLPGGFFSNSPFLLFLPCIFTYSVAHKILSLSAFLFVNTALRLSLPISL